MPTEHGHPRAVVLGDLVLDIVLLPEGPIRRGTDVLGAVRFRQGGSAATTARWLARSAVPTTLVTALGADGLAARLVQALTAAGVEVRAASRRTWRTGRLGVLVEADGERSFVADRGAILHLRPRHLRAAWFAGVDLLHLPAYSLLAEPLAASAGWAAERVAHRGGAVSVDLASAGFLDRFGPREVLDRVEALRPAVLLATAGESAAALGGAGPTRLLELAPLVVVKEGAAGARAMRQGHRDVVLRPRAARLQDSTGAGDAFDGGFLAAWLRAGPGARAVSLPAADLGRCLRAGHRAAWAEVTGPRPELDRP